MFKFIKNFFLERKGLILLIIAVNFFLNFYGNTWGLPYRWHTDEVVANVLHMAAEKSMVDPIGEFLHFTGYQLFLLVLLVPFFVFLKLTQYPLEELRQAANISWFHMANYFPEFASSIYIYARGLSAILGGFTIYIIYLLGKQLYSEKAGLFSAAFLSVSMGFVGVNHFAKYISLVNMLIALTLLLCVLVLGANDFKSSKRLFYLASFVGGLAFSVHFNALILSFPLFLTFILTFIRRERKPEKIGGYFYENVLKNLAIITLISGSFYVLGIITGMPSLITHFADYFSAFASIFGGNFSPEDMSSGKWYLVLIGPLNYLIEMAGIYGILIFMLIISGMIKKLFLWRDLSQQEILIFSFVFLYFFVITVLFEDKYPQTKHIIAIIPLLTIFAGKLMADIFQSKKTPAYFKYIFFLTIFFYSFAYSFQGNMVFKKTDTRYVSTRWIYDHVEKGSKIEVFDQLNYVASLGIMNDYNIIYLGRDSKSFKGKHFFKWNKVKEREKHFKFINQFDSRADYIIVDLNDINKIYSKNYMIHIPGLAQYTRDLFEGKKNFKITCVIKPNNQKIDSPKIEGLVYPEDIFWDPIPSYRVTANTIYIFKKTKEKNV